ncbi:MULTISPECIES: 4Fe-4S cluster-binding domain-containing protein [unclassified Streptomyces]|uniref:4Fe-4S cluster-binding domain-containing protein n=1 Tax=unclassified Streptomyces TaxID=2593676 RepID=UPI0003706E3E|nr:MULTISPECIES: 4Fe-4S cluster-binding domain-containing protein [unclassified Streptomyces]MYX39063.1 4Fe-4S cluster-binding domain-containing protein [Streptomyces sp. SID8377]
MIKEGAHTYIDGQGAVVPYTGKYAVRTENPFAVIRAGWDAANVTGAYRPLRVEFELTDRCNDTCKSCGMGAKPLADGVTLSDAQLDRLIAEFEDVALSSVAITGGEPFVAARQLYRFMDRARGTVDIGKITTNGIWGTAKRCAPTFERLVTAGLLENRIFVPLLMVSIGEQTTPLESVARIINHAVTQFTDRELNIALSSLADPADRKHRVYELLALYERMYGDFPHDRVHSTMRVYLENERLEDQAAINRPGNTTVTRWMGACYDCFAPTVGTYVLPCALMKVSGDLYSCAAFNVPEKLGFGNLFQESFRDILDRVNSSAYVRTVRAGHGLKGVGAVVPPSVTDQMTCGSFCGSCKLLIDRFEEATGQPEPGGRLRTFIPLQAFPCEGSTAPHDRAPGDGHPGVHQPQAADRLRRTRPAPVP